MMSVLTAMVNPQYATCHIVICVQISINISLDGIREVYDWRAQTEAGDVNLLDDEDSDTEVSHHEAFALLCPPYVLWHYCLREFLWPWRATPVRRRRCAAGQE